MLCYAVAEPKERETELKARRIAFLLVLVAVTALAACDRKTLPTVAVALKPGAVEDYRISIDTYDDLRERGEYRNKYESHQIFDVRQRVSESGKDQRQVEVVVQRIQLQTELAGGATFRFDSSQPAEVADEMHRPLYAMLNRKLLLTVDSQGHVTKVEGFDAIAAAVAAQTPGGKASPEIAAAFAAHYGADFVASIYETFLTSLPPAGTPDVEEWTAQRTVYNAFLGKLAFSQRTALENPGEKSAIVRFEGVIRPSEQAEPVTKQLPRTGMALTLRQGTVKGDMEIDRGRGRLEKLAQEVVLYLGLEQRPRDKPGQRVTVKTYIERLD